MATSSWCLPSVLFLLAIALLLSSCKVSLSLSRSLSLLSIFCAPRCAVRCSKTSHQKPCLFFCNKCCQKCLCVPSGTYGNKEECPCYNNWTTQEGKPKCP
ncbi:unnamed protein product [Spirodela intermedia]|uniref:Uncharacterized protein n=2 Tax=Spirodela intermedia TaxID=51605 RepID=A0A7I8JCJ2_SPIIN|nr:unnamed protein product [Spirodela intermedia]CAA6667908.1 unnamed protein product [Spirodela intermedia]CAA7404727.1 unnamed protein product [Spirodela intermedia]